MILQSGSYPHFDSHHRKEQAVSARQSDLPNHSIDQRFYRYNVSEVLLYSAVWSCFDRHLPMLSSHSSIFFINHSTSKIGHSVGVRTRKTPCNLTVSSPLSGANLSASVLLVRTATIDSSFMAAKQKPVVNVRADTSWPLEMIAKRTLDIVVKKNRMRSLVVDSEVQRLSRRRREVILSPPVIVILHHREAHATHSCCTC
eukprot:COSAG01_NODE_18843_length_1049_cov_1.829474_1_plen_200_part_00